MNTGSVEYLRKRARVNSSMWFKIEAPNTIGWVNRRYLCDDVE